MEKTLRFEELPASVIELHRKIDILLKEAKQPPEQDRLLTIELLIDYLPEHPAKQTIYGWVNFRTIPYEKYGKRLYFRKAAIDFWLSNGRKTK
jgi:hypothetical protein